MLNFTIVLKSYTMDLKIMFLMKVITMCVFPLGTHGPLGDIHVQAVFLT